MIEKLPTTGFLVACRLEKNINFPFSSIKIRRMYGICDFVEANVVDMQVNEQSSIHFANITN